MRSLLIQSLLQEPEKKIQNSDRGKCLGLPVTNYGPDETREESEREKNSSQTILAQSPGKLYLSWQIISSDVG